MPLRTFTQKNQFKTFVSMKTFLIGEKEKDNLYYVCAWVLEERFYFEDGKIIQGSGSSISYKFVVEKINDVFEVMILEFQEMEVIILNT